MSPQGGTSSSNQMRKCLRRTQRLCKLQLVTQECSKINQELRPPNGQQGPCCLLRGWLIDGRGVSAGWAERQWDRWPEGARRNGRDTKVLLTNWSDFYLVRLQLQNAPGLHFQHKNCVFQKVSSKIIKKWSAYDAAGALHEEHLPTLCSLLEADSTLSCLHVSRPS